MQTRLPLPNINRRKIPLIHPSPTLHTTLKPPTSIWAFLSLGLALAHFREISSMTTTLCRRVRRSTTMITPSSMSRQVSSRRTTQALGSLRVYRVLILSRLHQLNKSPALSLSCRYNVTGETYRPDPNDSEPTRCPSHNARKITYSSSPRRRGA